MARPLRIQYKNALSLVTCRGYKLKAIFRDDRDKKQFLELLNDCLKTYTTLLYGYVLMENHFHLLFETPLANLSEFMKWINITYTAYYNKRYKRTGRLYQGRYKSILLEKKEYLDIVSRYIHLNPVNTRLGEKLPLSEKIHYLRNCAWSSLPGIADITKRNGIVEYAGVLEPYGGDNKKGRQLYWEAICSDLLAGIEIKDKVVGGNILGSTGFIDRVRDKYLPLRSREILPARRLKNYTGKVTIIKVLCKETKKSFDEIKAERGVIRQIALDLLYRFGGLNGTEIGEMMGIGYSAVSLERKRLREKLKGNRHLSGIVKRIEAILQL